MAEARPLRVQACELPVRSHVEPRFLCDAYLADAFQAPLLRDRASTVDLFFAIFGHHPLWLKLILLLRHRVGALFGLAAAPTAALMRPLRQADYRAGQAIGPWPLYFVGDEELIAGRENRHLDFRLSVLRQGTGAGALVVVSTFCCAHNGFGRLYLRLIKPFHQWGVQRLLRRALDAGRL